MATVSCRGVVDVAAKVAGAVGATAEVMGDLQRAAGAAERLIELLTVQPTIASPPAARRGKSGGAGAGAHDEDEDDNDAHAPARCTGAAAAAPAGHLDGDGDDAQHAAGGSGSRQWRGWW